MARKIDYDALIQGTLDGDTRSIARMMSEAEAGFAAGRAAMAEIYKHAGKAHVIGLTGVPGSGKSTLVAALTKAVRASGRRVGIVAVDPSSPFSGGAILGDRVRMAEHTTDDGVFIRSLATRGSLGGLARAAMDTVDILDAAGFDLLLIETVGVGQDEVDIALAAHSVVVVSAPGLGDDIQAIKAGVLEIADIHVVSKADRDDANKTAADLRAMLNLGLTGRDRRGWNVQVLLTSSERGEGIDDLLAAIDAHGVHLNDTGELAERRRAIAEMRVLKIAEDIVRDQITAGRDADFKDTLDAVGLRALDPQTAARDLLRSLKIES